jgi:hypothetical protein
MDPAGDQGAVKKLIDVPGYRGPDRRTTSRTESAPDGTDPRTPLVREARALLARVVTTIVAAKERTARGQELIARSHEHLVWSDAFLADAAAHRHALRAVVGKLARLERAQGVPPEKMLVLMKDLLRAANAGTLARDEARALTEDIVLWSIEDYFAA